MKDLKHLIYFENQLVRDFLYRLRDLCPLPALVRDEDEVRDLLHDAALYLLDTGLAVYYNIVEVVGQHADDFLQIRVDAAIAALVLRAAYGEEGF